MHVTRFDENPIITPDMLDGDDGANINGPSLIRAPDWPADPLGRYYLYFAHHGGDYIRLAYADDLRGPWTVHRGGTLHLRDAPCRMHIASPDVHVDHARKQIRMYYHGVVCDDEGKPVAQRSFVATSPDGLHFDCRPEILGPSYFRVFQWGGMWYASTFGDLYKAADQTGPFEPGPRMLPPTDDGARARHTAVHIRGDELWVFHSRIGDTPERILLSRIRLTDDWTRWIATEAATVLEPQTNYEGVELPIETSVSGLARGRVRQLRDPAVYEQDGRTYLLYSVAGESGIAIAEVKA